MLKKPYEEILRDPRWRPFRIEPDLIERLCGEEEPSERRTIYRVAVRILAEHRNAVSLRRILEINRDALRAVVELAGRLFRENGCECTKENFLERWDRRGREEAANEAADWFCSWDPDSPEFWVGATGERLHWFLGGMSYGSAFEEEYRGFMRSDSRRDPTPENGECPLCS